MIAAANVLSDLYAMGVSHCDSMLMLLGWCECCITAFFADPLCASALSREMTPEQRSVIIPLIIKGFNGTGSNHLSDSLTVIK